MDAADRSQVFERLQRESGIRRALDAADAPRYSGPPGPRACRVCGRRIPAKRIAALPWADTCIGCRLRLEEGRP